MKINWDDIDHDELLWDYDWTSNPLCPFCHKAYKEWWDGTGLNNDEDDTLLECPNCGKEYVAKMSLEPTFNTAKPVLKQDSETDNND